MTGNSKVSLPVRSSISNFTEQIDLKYDDYSVGVFLIGRNHSLTFLLS